MRFLLNPRNLLPSLLFFGVLALGLHAGDVWRMLASGKMPAIAARAADAPAPEAAPSPPSVDAGKTAEGKDNAPPANESTEAKAAAAEASEASPAEKEVLGQLAKRRDQLDKRAHELDTREELMKVGEQRVDQKIKEMQSIRLQLQAMVDQINGAQQTQLENLVKIYETMKPADAAKIFEALDMPVLLNVIQRMKPKSTAPILAAMKPEKAKEVTVSLTKVDQIPAEKEKK